VGAGGHLCPVARALGARPADEPSIVAQEVELILTPMQAELCHVDPGTPDLQLCRDLRGYGWCFRKGDRLNIGLGRQDSADLPAHVRAFAEALVSSGTVPPGLATRWKGHAYLLRDASTRAVVDDGVLLAGDAAGLACAVSGEGIRPAIESGFLAAATILAADGRFTRDALQPYADGLETRFPRSHRTALSSWSRGLAAAMVGPLLSTPWFSRHVLLERWFLQAA
jgi:flavin-dependent dehydrogenase